MLPLRLGAAAALALCLTLTPFVAEAQLGGIVKKAKEQVTPATGQTVDEPARLPGPQVTPDIVKRLLTGLSAEKRELDRAAERQQRRTDSIAEARRKAPKFYRNYGECLPDKMASYPEMERATELGRQAADAQQKGETRKALELTVQLNDIMLAANQAAEEACAPLKGKPDRIPPPEPALDAPDEAAVRAATDTAETLGAGAAKLTAAEYAQLKELVYTYLNYPQKAGLAAEEKRAVDPKRKELKDALGAVGLR